LATLERWGKPFQKTSETLADIRNEIGTCSRCTLAKARTNIVFGTGNEKAKLVFVGNGPGAEEDQISMPFTGAAGQLLTKIIEAIRLKREDVYLCDVTKCRPRDTKRPSYDEINTCTQFVKRQIMAINPKVVCTLGTIATTAFLNTDAPVADVRGRFYDFNGIKVMPTFHPAFLLDNPGKKRDVWKDMQKIMALLNK
jgi:uracil-DNA glycosylase family 4